MIVRDVTEALGVASSMGWWSRGALVRVRNLTSALSALPYWPSPNRVHAFFHLHWVHHNSRCSIP